ncbi:MAG: phosphatidylglycerophosphatase A [Planctomycetota bacterium]
MKRSWSDWFVLALGTGLFLGMVPPRTATLAALLGLPLAMGLHALVGWTWYLPILAVLCLLGIPICKRSAELLGCADPREVTYDEYVTVPIVFFMVPAFTWKVLLVGFLLHRFFDILKPLGIAQLERLGGGLGIMSDDILSGVYGLAVMRLLIVNGFLV